MYPLSVFFLIYLYRVKVKTTGKPSDEFFEKRSSYDDWVDPGSTIPMTNPHFYRLHSNIRTLNQNTLDSHFHNEPRFHHKETCFAHFDADFFDVRFMPAGR